MKVALVTGSARRLGRGLAERLSASGYAVWIHYRRSGAQAERVAADIAEAGGRAHVIAGDLGDPDDVDRLVERVHATSGRLDVLVNNVGHYPTGNLLQLDPDHFKRTLDVNLLGPQRLIHRGLSLFPESGGHIINIGYTGLAALSSSPTNTAYVVSKTGLLLLTRTYADLLGPRRIRVNMVSPGQLDNSVDLPANFSEHVPLGRAGRVDDVVEAVMFLLDDRAGYITGQNLEVAGGYMLRAADYRAVD